VFEFVGGLFSGSMALISDAFHVLADGAENMINVVVSRLSRKNWDEEGSRKLGGMISGWLLLFMGVLIVYEGWERFHEPHEVEWYMTIIATAGLGVNLRQKWLHNQALSEHRNSQHFWQDRHLWSDILASIAVILGGLIMIVSDDLYWIDGALSIAIGMWIVILTAAKLLGVKLHSHNHEHKHGEDECKHRH
jgi:cobalt-zinc-cadmium efflux system protein